MNLVLKRFSQDVDLLDPDSVQYFLVFQKDGESEVRLPVQKETTEALVKLLYGGEVVKEAEDDEGDLELRKYEPPEDVSEATEFGGGDEDEEEPQQEEEQDDMPSSEDEVPSL